MGCRYQFNPDLYNADVVVNILIKAMTAAPQPDFNLCLALLGERDVSRKLFFPTVPELITRPHGQSALSTQDETDTLPALLPLLTGLSTLLHQCRFPTFWTLFRSEDLEALRDNYTVECVGFEDSVREVAIRAVRAAFQRIGRERLGNYLDLEGTSVWGNVHVRLLTVNAPAGEALDEYIARLGWSRDPGTGVVGIPANPDNRIESTIVRENIQLPREFLSCKMLYPSHSRQCRAVKNHRACASSIISIWHCIIALHLKIISHDLGSASL
jgi:translation initiation factor 3 subunit K